MKKIPLILVLLVFLGGGGAAAWWFVLRPGEVETAAVEPPGADPAFIEFEPMAVPVIDSDGTIRTFIVQLTLELPSEDALDPVTELLPRLKDRLLVILSELLGRRFVEESGYDQALIKAHLERVARQVAGPDRLSAVLIRSIEEFRRG